MLVSTLFAGLLAGSLVSTSPLDSDAAVAMRAEEGQMGARADSGCYYFASPKCCVPTVCMCLDSRIYQINRDAQNAGCDGCDPPWGLIANSSTDHPDSCC